MFNNWPYTNLNELNLDWILQQVKGIEDKYKDLDSTIAAGVEAVQHQEEVSLQDMDNMKMTIISAINGARDVAIVDVNATKTNALNDIETDKTDALAAIAALGNTWDAHYESLIAEMPADLASLTQTLAILGRILTGESEQIVTFFMGDYAGGSKTTPTPSSTSDVSTNMIIGGAGFKFSFTLDDDADADTKIYAIRWFEGKNADTGVYTGEHVVSCGNVRTYTWTIPDTCYGFSITLRNSDTLFTEAPASDIVTFTWNSIIFDFVSVDDDQNFTDEQKAQGRENIGAADEDDVTELQSKMNFDDKILGLDWLAGFIAADGSFSAGGTDRLASRFIPCRPGINITYVSETDHANVCGIAFYNKSTTFISGEKNNATLGTPATTTTPAGTAYLRLSTKVSIKDQTYLTFGGNNSQVLAWLQRQINDVSIYVDGVNGNDSTGAGTTGAPYKTIGKALQMGGRNICVKPGTYQEKVSASFLEYLHIYADRTSWAAGTPDTPKVVIDGNSTTDTPLDLSYIRKLRLEDIVVQYSASDKKGCVITYCNDLEMQNCEFNHNGHDGCVINYTNGVIRDCKASYNGNDGFNMNYYGDTQFYNCSGHDNADDGISHHQGTTGMINGGEWYNNGKGGVASPAHGSQIDIYNVYCHDNGYGIYANADNDTTARTFHVWNSVLVNNSHYGITSKRNTAIMYNCKITGNTDGQTTAPSGGSIITL